MPAHFSKALFQSMPQSWFISLEFIEISDSLLHTQGA